MIGHLELLMIDAKDISWGSAIAHFNLIAEEKIKSNCWKAKSDYFVQIW